MKQRLEPFAKNRIRLRLMVGLLAITGLFVVYAGVTNRQVLERAWALVTGALTGVSLNGGVTAASDNTDITSATVALSPDTGAYTWTVSAANLMGVNVPFQSGLTQTDFSGNASHFTVNGATFTTAGCKVGPCMSFDGVDDYLSQALPVSVKTPNITFAAWVKPNNFTGAPMIISASPRGTNAAGRGFHMNLGGLGNIGITKGSGDGSFEGLGSLTAISTGVWSFIAGTYDGAALRVYVNGVLDNTVADTQPIEWNDSGVGNYPDPAQLYIGAYKDNAVGSGATVPNLQFFNGLIDEVQIYPRALSAAQIGQLYTDGNVGLGGPTIIKSAETSVGNIWNLTVTPITSAGSVGAGVTSSNTVTVTDFTVTTATPPQNAINVSRSGNIVLTFNGSLNTGTVTSATLPVYSEQRGLIAGSYSFSTVSVANDTVTFNPTNNLFPNEQIEFIVKSGIQSNSGLPLLQRLVYRYTTASSTVTPFNQLSAFSNGTLSSSLATLSGDFNNDGNQDLVVTNEGPDATEAARTYQGNGDGTFTFVANYGFTFNDRPRRLASGDFNKDGNLDFVVFVSNVAFARVFIGNGDLTFTTTDLSTGLAPHDGMVGDFNGDGNLDIAATNINGPNTVYVFLGNGNGTFGASTTYNTNGSRMFTGEAGDFNNDKIIDLIVGDFDNQNVYLLLGNANGSFQAGTTFSNTTGNNNFEMYVNDFNNDGNLDLAIGSSSIIIMLGNGSGGLAFSSTLSSAGLSVQKIEGADVDADGDIDLILVGNNLIKLFINNGSGSFTTSTSLTVSGSLEEFSVGDFNNDGSLDVAAAHNNTGIAVFLSQPFILTSSTPARNALAVAPSSNISLVFSTSLNTGTVTNSTVVVQGSLSGRIAGAFSFSTTTVSNDTVTFNPTVDFQRGERVQITVTTGIQSAGAMSLSTAYAREFFVDATAGTNRYLPVRRYATQSEAYYHCVGDFDNDNDVDIAVPNSSSSNIGIYLNNGSGVFTTSTTVTAGAPFSVHCADVNGDGNDDIIYGSGGIGVLISNGNGTFAAAVSYSIPNNAYHIASGDFNADGSLDLAVGQTGAAAFAVLLNTGTGTFNAAVTYSTGTTCTGSDGCPRAITVADFNNDNRLDVATETDDSFGTSKVVVNLGNGNGTFGTASSPISLNGPDGRWLMSGDLNNDGNADLVAVHGTRIDVLLGNGSGGFAAPVGYNTGLVGGTPPSGALADFDSDNDLDIAIANQGAETLQITLNNGSGVFGAFQQFLSPGAWMHSVAVADFNGDGAMDASMTQPVSINALHVFINDALAPTVTITQPNGGETLTSGNAFDIIWRAFDNSGTVSTVNLELTTNDSSYSAVPSATGLPNGSAYPFLLTWGTLGSSNGQFNEPIGMEVDADGNIYVVDSNNARVQKFSSTGTFISSFGSSGTGNGQFSGPRDLTFDLAGNIYVTDTFNHRIQKFNSAGTYLAQWGTLGTANGQFDRPWGIDISPTGSLYVVEQTNSRVQVFNTSGTFQFKWGTAGSGNGQFNGPRMIAIDGSTNIYVADESNHRIQKFNSGGTYITQWGTFGTGNGQFEYSQGVAVDPQGNIFVSDASERVQKFSNTGTFILSFGSLGTGNGQFDRPFDMMIDPQGQMYVADTFNNRVQKFTPGGRFAWTVPVTTTSLARIRATAVDAGSLSAQDVSDATFTISGANSAPTAPTTLFSNNTTAQTGLANPTGLTDTTPAFSAICNDPDVGDILNKYRIQVDNNNDFSSTVWDSGAAGTSMTNCTAGARSVDINFGGAPLALDGATYYWRIKFWDDSNAEGAFSQTISTNSFSLAIQGSSVQRTQITVPAAPTPGQPQAFAADTIRWYFSDQANNETGFTLLDANGNVLKKVEQTNLLYIEETLLEANTEYSGRRVKAFNSAGESAPSSVFTSLVTPMPAVTPVVVSATPTSLTVSTRPALPNLSQGLSAVIFELLNAQATGLSAAANLDSGWTKQSTYTFMGLEEGAAYQLRAKARNQSGAETGWTPFVAVSTSSPIQAESPVLTLAFQLRNQSGQPVTGGLINPHDTMSARVSVRNVGNASAHNVFVNMLMPAHVTLIPDSLRINRVVQTAAADRDIAQADQNAVSAISGELEPGVEMLLSFQLAFDQDSLRSLLVSANPTAAFQVSLSYDESADIISSQPLSVEIDLSQLGQAPSTEPEPEPAVPVEVPTAEELVSIGNVIQQIATPSSPAAPVIEPSPTTVSHDGATFNVDVQGGLQLTGTAFLSGSTLQFSGTTSEPFTIVTLIFNNNVTVIAVSDADGNWQTFVSAERLGIGPGQGQSIEVEAIAAKGDVVSNRVTVGEFVITRDDQGVEIQFGSSVAGTTIATALTKAGQQVTRFARQQEEPIQTVLSVAAPVVVIASAPIWGYIPYLPTLLYHVITYAVGLIGAAKKGKRFYGVIYDSITKEPLPLAIIRFRNQQGKLVATRVSDGQGRYEALLNEGTYSLDVRKPGYAFPSQLVTGMQDASYEHVYRPELGLSSQQEWMPDVPLDQTNVQRQWQVSGAFKKMVLAFRKAGNLLALPVLGIGAAASAFMTIVLPQHGINMVLTLLYVGLLGLQLLLRPRALRAWGIVYDAMNKAILPLVALQLIDGEGKVVASRLSDFEGRYRFLSKPGTYQIKAHKPGYEQGMPDQPQTGADVVISKPDQHVTSDIVMRPLS